MLLPDINVWLALTFESHVHHSIAKTWFDGLPNETVCNFCRLTQLGFLRLSTNRKAFPHDALSLPDTWQNFDLLMSDPRVGFAEEPARIETQWRTFTQGQSFSAKIWNDAYLAAFALTAGFEVVTIDQGFQRYQPLKMTLLRQ